MIIINFKSKIIADISKNNLKREFLENLNRIVVITDCYAQKETKFAFRTGSILSQVQDIIRICVVNKINFTIVDLDYSVFINT